jgi:hypothetical protein
MLNQIGDRARMRGSRAGALRTLVVALVLVACGTMAATASARHVEIVSQGEAPAGKLPTGVHYFKTIQSAVEATERGDWVLIEPGVYTEEVKVTAAHSGIWIRGMDRNKVILDGQNKPAPGGSNGIEIYKANNVWVENLTARNFDRATSNGPGGNEIWWNGGEGSGKIGAHGWWGRYLTAYDTSLNGGYGIFTNNEKIGEWDHIYASGFNDSGMYLGACHECLAVINHATMENSALGYSGSNSGGNLIIENSVISHNTDGLAPNSENPGDGPPPLNGACNPSHPWGPHYHKLPTFTSTEIERCEIFRNNLVEENNNINAPDNPSSAAAPWGAGIELPGTYGVLVENNTIKNNPTNGVLGFEYPNPYPPTEQTINFGLSGNRISNNTFSGNGGAGGAFAGDLMLTGGTFANSTNNCVSGNSFSDAVYPEKIEETWGCQNTTTPNPNLGFPAIFYLLELQEVSENRTPTAQPVPAEQETMPNPCSGVPIKNPVCP